MDQQKVILIVEAAPIQLGSLADSLEALDFRVLVARDGESALDQLEHDPPDLALVAISLPGIDGFETCRRMKEESSY